MKENVSEILNMVKDGTLSVDDAILKLKMQPYEDIGYARIDFHRKLRKGVAEVIYGESKTAEQTAGIMRKMLEAGQEFIMVTRIDAEKNAEVEALLADVLTETEYRYYDKARIAIAGEIPPASGIGRIVIATGGTSDIPVAEEAAVTAEALGNEVVRLYDVGVAGIHRLFDSSEEIMQASVVIAIAGMEGALASVVGGIASCPVIAVPTSVGYGAAFEGLSALLSMLNSCASGVSVVNIDNGYGAGYLAHLINHMGKQI